MKQNWKSTGPKLLLLGMIGGCNASANKNVREAELFVSQ